MASDQRPSFRWHAARLASRVAVRSLWKGILLSASLYMLAAVVFVPLAVVFGVVLLPSIFLMTFLLMYVPMQLGAGRLVYCLCGCLLVPRCCRRSC